MMHMRKHNSKGFTLVELLTVVVILGLIMIVAIPSVSMLIRRSKSDSRDSIAKTLEMSAKSYADSNHKVLPKEIGESTLITADQLKKSNYLKDNLVDADKHSCMEHSVVRVYKNSSNDFIFTPYLYCDGDDIPDEIVPEAPAITVKFTDTNGNAVANKNVSVARLDISIKGNEANTLSLDGYSYAIIAQYNEGANTVPSAEIFNSGTINANGNKSITINKVLRDYVDITTVTNFTVVVSAYNEIGGYTKVEESSYYKDDDGPICGETDGEPALDYWNPNERKRTISIKCMDGNGSGCVRDKYVKTFVDQMEDSYITIEDNAGNKTDCPVRVHLDWTAPTVTIKAYKRNSDGSKGAQVASIVADDANRTKTLKSYENGIGADSWLNVANFQYGLYYEVTVTDNVTTTIGDWHLNDKNKPKDNATDFDGFGISTTHNFDSTNTVASFTLTDDGWRKGAYIVNDKAHNTTRVNILAALDLNIPTCVSRGGQPDWTKNNITISGTCSDHGYGSGCKQTEVSLVYSKDIKTDTASAGQVVDIAENVGQCTENQRVWIDKTAPTAPTVTLYKWQNNAVTSRPTSSSGLTSISSGTWSNVKLLSVPTGSTDGGCGFKGYSYTTSNNSTPRSATYYNIESEGTTTVKWRACDNLDNCSVYTDAVAKVDTVAPTFQSIGYWYRASTYGRGDNCQIIPSPGNKCNFTAVDSGTNNGRLVPTGGGGISSACKNQIVYGLWGDDGSSTCDSSTVRWSPELSKSYTSSTDYINNIFSLNGGNGYVWLDPVNQYNVSDATSTIKIKRVFYNNGLSTNFAMDASHRYYSNVSGESWSDFNKALTPSNRGVTFKFYIEDYAGNSNTWNVVVMFTGVCVYGGFWKYTPLGYNLPANNYNSFAHGWVYRSYVRTYMDEDHVKYQPFWSYYSDSSHPILPGEGTCDWQQGCQLHGWYKIGGVLYYFNTNEISPAVLPNGGMAANRSVRACIDSSHFLATDNGNCDKMTRWCNGSGACS